MTGPPNSERAALPRIVQGGMGVAISTWRLANAVGRAAQLGVVSGTGIDTVLVRRLQDGDPQGHVRRAMRQFPIARTTDEVLRRYFRPEGRAPGEPYALLPMDAQDVGAARREITMLGSFVEVFLAKEGHASPIGINLLTKVQAPTLPALFGAMLAGVEYVFMGAGIPRDIPAALDRLAEYAPARIRFEVEGLPAGAAEFLELDPGEHPMAARPALSRPRFVAIVSSHSLATMLARKASGRVDGFVVEAPTAGGHNAPPRGEPRFDSRGEPVYGERDEVDLEKLRELGLPFWIAGGASHPERLVEALASGAAGIQVGTLFALCDESGLVESVKRSLLAHAGSGTIAVRTDPHVSPTGYPFKIVDWPENPARDDIRERVCDLGYLRVPYVGPDGRIGYRCASEPVRNYLRKGGDSDETVGRECLCNRLFASAGMPQVRAGGKLEPPIVTGGDDLAQGHEFLRGRSSYSAADVVAYLLSPPSKGPAAR